VQVHGEGNVGVGAGVDGAIIVVTLWDRDFLGSSELLFQVMGDGLLLLPSKGGGALTRPSRARPSLIQGLACGSHDNGSGGLLLVDEEVGGAAWHGRQDNGG
jgi:hypothetical protein